MPNVDITIRTIDQSEQANRKAIGSLTELNSAIMLVRQGVEMANKGWDATVGELDRYAAQVEKVSRLTGMNAEESSKLIQVSDDLQISYESLATSLTIAAKKQDLSIDSIAALSDKYLSFTTAQEQADFAAQTFGRNYTEMVKLLEVGGDKIKQMGADTPAGLVIDEKQIQDIKAYRREIDAWQDSFQALKLTVGGELVTAFNEGAVKQKIYNQLMEDGNKVIVGKIEHGRALTGQEQAVYDAVKATAEAQYYQTDSMTAANEAAEELRLSIEETSKANQDLMSLMTDFQSIADDYNGKQKDLQTSTDELMAKKTALIAQGYGPESQAIQDVNAKLSENNAKYAENAQAAEDATKRKIVAMLEARLSADGLDNKEFDALLKLQNQWGLLSDEAMTSAKGVNEAINTYLQTGDIDTFTGSIDKATEALLRMPEKKDVEINLITSINGESATVNDFQNILGATATVE